MSIACFFVGRDFQRRENTIYSCRKTFSWRSSVQNLKRGKVAGFTYEPFPMIEGICFGLKNVKYKYIIISNAICYTMLCMLEWMQNKKHRIGTP